LIGILNFIYLKISQFVFVNHQKPLDEMTTLGNSGTTLGHKLNAKNESLAKRLFAANFDCVTQKIRQILESCLAGEGEKPIFERTILFKELGITLEDIKDTTTGLQSKLMEWTQKEELSMSIAWRHECNYCEDCQQSGCGPCGLLFSWKKGSAPVNLDYGSK
jgi:hypothetical protein